MVSEAFKRCDKYTDSNMIKINPQLQPAQNQSTASHSEMTTPPVSAVGSGMGNEEDLSSAISD